jgi:hypothetical protein
MMVFGIVFLAVAACLALSGFIAVAAGVLRNLSEYQPVFSRVQDASF